MGLTDIIKNNARAAAVGGALLGAGSANAASVTQTIFERPGEDNVEVVETYSNNDNATYDSLQANAAASLGDALYSITENQDDYSSAQDLFNSAVGKTYESPLDGIHDGNGWDFSENPFTLTHTDLEGAYTKWTDGKDAQVIYSIPKSLLDDVDSPSFISADWSPNDPDDYMIGFGDKMSDAATAYEGGAGGLSFDASGKSYVSVQRSTPWRASW
jgi:hypothetical protein